jgi:arylsulfatase A-like enzyme
MTMNRVACLLACLPVFLACSSDPPPNILIYVVDTLRADALGTYGRSDANTPSFDTLAREGIVFEHAYANASWTRASMASLLTGLQPWHHGTEDRDDRIPEDVPGLATWLRGQGYRTALVSSNPNVGTVFGFERGFDEVIELYARTQPGTVRGKELVTPSDVVTRAAVEWLQAGDEPFFMVVLAIDPHAPYVPPRRFDPAIHRRAAGVGGHFDSLRRSDLTEAEKARIRELYQAEVSFNDHSFGALVSELKKQRRYDETIAVVTSDHGEEFWEYGRRGHGRALTDALLHVPLILRYPGSRMVLPGGRTTHPISLIDLAPTLLELANLDLPDDVDGRAFFSNRRDADAPLAAGLRLDGRILLAARTPSRKLVWDVDADRLALHDLALASPEAVGILVSEGSTEAETQRGLRAFLEENLADARRSDARTDALPKDVEASLKALGYLE